MRFFVLGGLVKETCLQILYEKTLRLSLSSLQKASSGKLINLVACLWCCFGRLWCSW